MTMEEQKKKQKIPPLRARALSKPRELHVFDEGVGVKGLRRYRIEITHLHLGRKKTLRKFPAHANQLERLKLRYMREFRVPEECVFFHALPVPVAPAGGTP